MRQYELHPPHLINVMLLHYLVKVKHRTENVISQRDITKENCIRCIRASSKRTRVIMCLKFTYVGVIQQIMHEIKIHDIDDL